MVIWCSHCPASDAQIIAPDVDPQVIVDAHIDLHHPGTGPWVEGDDWEILNADTRAELAQHLETLTA